MGCSLRAHDTLDFTHGLDGLGSHSSATSRETSHRYVQYPRLAKKDFGYSTLRVQPVMGGTICMAKIAFRHPEGSIRLQIQHESEGAPI
jgi:hypothetical protein